MNRQRSKTKKLIKDIAVAILEEVEVEISVSKRKRLWERKWIQRRNELGATNSLLKEIELEDPREYYATFRMSQECFNFLLMKVQSQIQRNDTHLRSAVRQKPNYRLLYTFLLLDVV